jgi:4-hydroxy 2-oxovalerate aldolase
MNIEYHDLTLRDGSHAISHQVTREMIEDYCTFAESAGVKVVEVGHGCGQGASSVLIGESLLSDAEMVSIARQCLAKTKLSVHIIPGFATIARDIEPAIHAGVDIFRVASHCTEASVTKTHIEYLKEKNKTVYGVLMLSATCSTERLLHEATKMKTYGATGIIIMDSTGSFLPNDIAERITALKTLDVPLGFHGHDNLRLAVANSLVAIEHGATIIDVTMRGFGGGAGNTPFEVIAGLKPTPGLDMSKLFEKCSSFAYSHPVSKPVNILTALHKLVSVFDRHIVAASKEYDVSIDVLVAEMGRRKLVAGQEDFVKVVAESIVKKNSDKIYNEGI